MAVDVNKESHFSLHMEAVEMVLCVENSGMEIANGVLPSSVQVNSEKRASVMPENDSIWVDHWNNLEDQILSKLLSFRR